MKKLNLKSLKIGSEGVLNRDQLKTIFGGQVPDYCFENQPGYQAECREIALGEYRDGGCPTWNSCFVLGATGCVDTCMSTPGGQ